MSMKRSNRTHGIDEGGFGNEDYSPLNPDEQKVILEKLEPLKTVPERDTAVVESGRVAFLESARSLTKAVSPALPERHKWWKNIRRKERSTMFSLARVALALILAFGAAGSTIAVAQASEPGDVLYPVKIASEDLRLALTSDSEQAFELQLKYAQERLEEIEVLSEESESIPLQVTTRLQEHFQQALQEASNFDDENLAQAMERVAVMTQQQTRVLQQKQTQDAGNAVDALQQAEQIVSRIRAAAEEGLEDPITFRLRHGSNRPEDAPEQPDNVPSSEETPGNQQGPGGQQGSGKGPGGK
jgi:hypothetical protein